MLGGRYKPPAAGQVLFGLVDEPNNARISFEKGGLINSATVPDIAFRLRANSVILPTGVNNPGKVTLTVKPATGEFSGTFVLVDTDPYNDAKTISRTATFSGVIATGSQGTYGMGFFTLTQLPDPFAEPPTTVTTAPIWTGSVVLGPN